ncbi:MAG: hypothetical protein M3N09_06700 [Actinomycetota bacterium]|nr:hypothetical protein [Actinomycetota bacterium]
MAGFEPPGFDKDPTAWPLRIFCAALAFLRLCVSAAISLAIFGFGIVEPLASLRYLRRVGGSGGSAWQRVYLGSKTGKGRIAVPENDDAAERWGEPDHGLWEERRDRMAVPNRERWSRWAVDETPRTDLYSRLLGGYGSRGEAPYVFVPARSRTERDVIFHRHG